MTLFKLKLSRCYLQFQLYVNLVKISKYILCQYWNSRDVVFCEHITVADECILGFFLRLVIFGIVELTAYSQYFSNFEQTKLHSFLSERKANSALHCCYQCSRVSLCRSMSYNAATRDCFLSETLVSDISNNSVT